MVSPLSGFHKNPTVGGGARAISILFPLPPTHPNISESQTSPPTPPPPHLLNKEGFALKKGIGVLSRGRLHGHAVDGCNCRSDILRVLEVREEVARLHHGLVLGLSIPCHQKLGLFPVGARLCRALTPRTTPTPPPTRRSGFPSVACRQRLISVLNTFNQCA